MAHFEVQTTVPVMSQSSTQAVSHLTERRLRRTSAWLLLFFLIQGELGAVWDREWHAYVGRDQFWTPPHTLIYSCVTGAGLIALTIVLIETYRYRHGKAGVDDSSTVSIFWYFHAPLGFSVLGFGALLALIAAPLDNYWHELYGIDIALWAPFHMMGVAGGLIGILGMIYIFASEAAIQRQMEQPVRRYLGLTMLELGVVMALASFLNFVLTGFLQFPLVSIGTISISTYPLPIVMGGAFCLISVVRQTYKPGSATLLVFFLLLHTLLVELFVPWAIRTSVALQDLLYRPPGAIPYFSLAYALLPLIFLIPALMVDGFVYWKIRRSGKLASGLLSVIILGTLMAVPTFLIAPIILQFFSTFAPVFLPQSGLPFSAGQMLEVRVIGVLIGLLAGSIGGVLGADFGDVWHWNER